ncbi:hypothetical protein PsAD2_03540 [Pseudovibrio axinellae]|uniref:Uncharacterized protein n=1 Tax=Pseudovibrio axinellae TaxID=989403 RepID=A0A165W0Q5_9HYPH|nr:hypothetical protein [Pseudovibrio axinellae]KZL15771.1 hypothetical protein PsAD2_03540 [Pseudovibrio axinellae]SEQ62444.1 hypothetical protein SAMN05421798_103262 [Pseudovibrio axinellae]
MGRSTGTGTGTGKLAAYVDFFKELVKQDPDITLFELRDAFLDAKVSKFIILPLLSC